MENSKDIEIYEQRQYKVVKANEIIQRAKYDLTITELKILAYIFSKIKPTDTELKEYIFTLKDYCLVCGINDKNTINYRMIKENLKALRDKSFYITDENGNDVLVGWLQKVKINKGSGKVIVKLDEDMQKYVLNLLDNYTQYALLSTLPMTSSYSFRLYELLKSYAFTKRHSFDIDELKQQLVASHYKNFKDFRMRVLEMATKEINLYTDIEISWQPEHKGRKVVAIVFDIKQRDSWGTYYAHKRGTSKLDAQLTLFDYIKE